MKAAISTNGILMIKAERETERYALKTWWEDFCESSPKAAIAVDWEDLGDRIRPSNVRVADVKRD